MANPVSSVDVPLSLFSSLDTELSPPDLPEGISPDNSDVIYLPGSVSTRPGYQRVLTSFLRASGNVTYEKTFIPPNKQTKNLYFTNDGTLWVEDVINDPGEATVLFSSSATMASSVTAFGREYIALSDGVHGSDIPLQYDGSSVTGNLWRVTQDGPGDAPVVNSVALPPATLATSAGPSLAVANIQSSAPVVVGGVTYYITLAVNLTAPSVLFQFGQRVVIAGNSVAGYNVTGTVNGYFGSTVYVNVFVTAHAFGTGGTISLPAATLSRSGNTVTGNTQTPHGLMVGYQVEIQGVAATAVGSGIVSIVLNNQDQPGIATVTTGTPHGLLPQNAVNISGVGNASAGSITNVAFAGDLVTITTSAAHGLSIGSEAIVAAVTNTTVNGQWSVLSTPTPNTFTYAFVSIIAAYSAADTGTVSYLWPLANVDPSLNYFTVQTCPSANTFTVALSYTNGTWTGGTVTFGWDGIFYVTAVLSSVSFQYQQYGPAAFTTSAGTATPYGQASPGIHQCQQCFLLASGAITAPSPSTTFVANGGQYLAVSGLAIGGYNVVGRILLFTGAGGAFYFYIPVAAQVNGIQVSTATQINDNVTTNVLLDFADSTLYAATACSIPGNNLDEQVTLGLCAGFFTYATRLQAWGEYNKVQNLLNPGFGGGYVTVGTPSGWTLGASGTTSLLDLSAPRSLWLINLVGGGVPCGTISQNVAFDQYGAPILLPNTEYTLQMWINSPSSDLEIRATLASASTGFFAMVTFPGPSALNLGVGSIQSQDFVTLTPSPIPSDLMLSIYAVSATGGFQVALSEVEMVYTQQPYLDTQERLSYAENPEGFDGITGVLGPEDDSTPIMNHGVIRQTLYLVTGGSVHETQDNGSTEPSGWDVNHVADNCGAWSIASVARNPQGIGSAGKEWMTWSGPDGAQVFDGRQPEKVSQEIQSLWDAVDASLLYQCWAKNDQTNKRCYYGIPLSPTKMQVLVLDYRNLPGDAIGSTPPVHISFTGKMIASDLTRKWTQWNGGNFYYGELMYRTGYSQLQMVFGGGGPVGGANVYALNPAQYQDDDFGQIPAYYTTYFFVSHEMEQALQVGSHRHLYTLSAAFISGVGTWSLIPYATSLNNPFPQSAQYPLISEPGFDMDFGINVETTRCAFKVQAAPIGDSLDSYFKLQKMVINMAKAPWAPVRGSSSGRY